MLRRLWVLPVKAIQRLEMAVASLIALGRRRGSYIVDRRVGADDGEPIDGAVIGALLTGNVCIFAHLDRRGEVHDYVLHYLECLRDAGFKIVFVSNTTNLRPLAMADVSALAQLVLLRKNAGGYFGAYKDAIAAIGGLGDIDLLLLANDSLYGPFWGLSDIFRRMATLRGQFWALTDNWQRAYHLDSDFMLFGREAIGHPAFGRFWRGVRYVNSRSYEFRQYEVGLSQVLFRNGLRGGVLCSYRDLSRVVIDAVRNGALNSEKLDEWQEHLRDAYELVQKGKPFDISAYLWDYLVTQMSYPFIKRDLFQRNRVIAPYISHWHSIVARESDYDPDLIVRHLEATLKNRFT
jgi:lipopolysaccharide biosynthesis protein